MPQNDNCDNCQKLRVAKVKCQNLEWHKENWQKLEWQKQNFTMNHRHRRAALRDPGFSDEAFNAFNSGDAYIRAAQDGLARATD